MNATHPTPISSTLAAALAFLALASPARAATFSTPGATPPTVDGADIANLVAQTGNEKWWSEVSAAGTAKGQTFTTGSSPVILKAISYRINGTSGKTAPATYTIRVGTVSGTSFSQIYAETSTQEVDVPQTGTADAGGYMTWTFATPVLLLPNTKYGIDVGMNTSAPPIWIPSNINLPYISLSAGASYGGGDSYTSGSAAIGLGIGSATIAIDTAKDRVFHLDMEVAPAIAYWDRNDTGIGAGSTTPDGTWDAASPNWNALADGTGSTAAWVSGQAVVFAAGTDATGPYTVTLDGTQDIGPGLFFEEGTVTLAAGTTPALRMTSNSTVNVATGLSAMIAPPITEDATARTLSKGDAGTLLLSGNNSYTGPTVVSGGKLILSGSDNSAATGGMTVYATAQFNSTGAINGTGRNITVNSGGTVMFGTMGNTDIATGLGRIATASPGTIAADNNTSNNFDFSATGASLTNASFGAVDNVAYVGTLMPNGTTYRLGGGGGLLTMANANALTGANSLVVNGNVTLAGNNDYTGTTTIYEYSTLTVMGSSATSGVTLNLGATLVLGNNASLGAGTLTVVVPSLASASTLEAVGTVVISNPVAANGNFMFGGTGALTIGAVTVNGNRNITNNNTTNVSTIASIAGSGGARALTFSGNGSTTVTGRIGGGTGITTLTKTGTGVLSLHGINTYTGNTSVTGGTLALSGTGFISSGTITVNGTTAAFMQNSSVTCNRPFTLTKGTLGGTGTIGTAITAGANVTLAPGDRTLATPAKGTLTVTNAVSLTGATSKANLRIFGSTANDCDKLVQNTTGTLTFGGVLQITLDGSLTPVGGTTYDLFDWIGTPTGIFESISLPALPPGFKWHDYGGGVLFDYSTGQIQIDADNTPPAIATLSPADDTMDVVAGANLVLNFNETVALGTGNITIINLTDATQTVIDITDYSQVALAGAVLTINPTADLTIRKSYAIRIDATAVRDLADNPFAGIADDTTWNFTCPAPVWVWTQTAGGMQDWDNAANWSGNNVPSPMSGETVDFSTVDLAADTSLTLGADRTAEIWRFGDTSGTQTWTVSADNKMILAGTTPTINVVNSAVTLNNVVEGTQGLTKTGPGTLMLSGTATYTGDTSVNEGTLRLASNNMLPDTAAIRIAASGATLDLDHVGIEVVGSLYIGETKQESGFWGAIGSGAQHETAVITGTGRIQVGVVPAIALALGSNPENIHTGSTLVDLLIGNTAPWGSMALNYTLGGVTGSGTRDAGDSGAVEPITGTYAAVPGINSFNITASDPIAFNNPQSVPFSQTAYNLATAATNPTVDMGAFYVGTSKALSIQNTAPAGIYSEDLAATLTAGANTIVSGSVANLVAGGSDSSSLLVTLGGSGPQTGQATLGLTSTGTVGGVTISGLGETGLAAQPVSISGTAYHLAAADSGQTVDLGAFHVGTAKTAPLTLTNTAPADATYSETLQSNGFSNISTNFTAEGSVSGIPGGGSGSGTLVVGVEAAAGVGEFTGTTTLALQSAAVNGSGLGITDIASQAITIRATGYHLASTGFSATEVNLAPIHVGDTFATQPLTIDNTLAAGTYHESLGAQFANAAGVATSGGPITVTAGAAADTSMSVFLAGTSPGMHSGTVDLQFDSQEINGSGLGTTDLPALGRTLTVSGGVFNGSGVWTLNSGTNGSWGAVDNWTDANGVHAAPGTFAGYDKTDTATFNGTGTAAMVTLDGTAPSLKTLVLSGATAYTIAQGAGSTGLTFKSNTATASLTASGAGHLLSAPVTLAGNLTVTLPSGSDSLAISGVISSAGGARGLTKAGPGTLTLGAANTYAGNTIVQDGTLVVSGPCLSDTATLTVGAASASSAILHLPNAGTDLVGTLIIDGVSQPAGLYDATNSNGAITGVGRILVDPFASFVSVIDDPADRDPADDPDADGIANAIEFVIGGNPASASDSALLPTVEVVTADLGGGIPTDYLKFTYRRTTRSLYMAPTVEYDVDLSGLWTAAANGASGIVIVTTTNGYASGVDRVEVYLPQTIAATGELFARLRVTVVP